MNFFKKISILVALLLSNAVFFAQTESDYLHLADSLYSVNIDSAIYYCNKAIELSTKNNNLKIKQEASINLGILYNEKGDLDNAKKTFLKCIDEAKSQKDTNYLIRAYGNISNTYQLGGNFDLAIKYMTQTIDLLKKTNQTHTLGLAYGALGNIYLRMKNYNQALEFYLLAEKNFKDQNSIDYAINSMNIAIIYQHLENYDLAKKELDTSIQIFKKLSDNLYLARAYSTLSNIYLAEADTTSGLKYQQLSLAIYYKLNAHEDIIISLSEIGSIFIKQKKYQQAIDTLTKAYQIASNYNNIYQLEKLSDELKICYEKTNNISQALFYANKYIIYHDSIYDTKTSEELSKLRVKYNTEQKQHEIDLLKAQKSRFRLFFIFSTIIFLLSLLFFYLLFKHIKTKNLAKETEIRRKLLQMQMNPHFIFNSLIAIQNFILKNETNLAADYVADFAILMRKTLNNSRKDFILISDEIETLKLYINFQKIRFQNKFEYEIHIDDDIQPDETMILPMLIQPFVENSIEHGFKNINYKGILKIFFSLSEKNIKIVIEDNGIGINNTNNNADKKISHKSLSIEITRERLQILAKEKHIENFFRITDLSEEDKQGTRVSITIPYITEF